MANSLTNIMPKILARALMSLRQQCIMPRLVNGDYSIDARAKGDTIDVPVPTAVSTATVAPSYVPVASADVTPSKVQVVLNNWKQNVPFALSDNDLNAIEAKDAFLPMQVGEAIKALARDVNVSILNEYTGIYGCVGTAGTTPFGNGVGIATATTARKVLNKQLCPRTDRRAVLDFDAEAAALELAAFSDAEKVGSGAVKIDGEIGRKFGIDWYSDDDVVTHTAGSITTGLIVKAATVHAVGVSQIVCTTAASTGACHFHVGDIILINGDTQTYVVTEAVEQLTAATDVTIKISPPLKKATVGSEAVTMKASHVVNLAFHRDAFAFATRPLLDVQGMNLGSQISTLQDPQTGLVLRLEVSRQHKQVAWEFDILWGVKLVRPELAVRILG